MSRLPRPVRCPGGEPDVAHAVESRSLAAELGRSCQPRTRGRPRLPSPDQECSPSSPRPEATSTKSSDSPSKAYPPERRVKARSPLIRTDHQSAPRQPRPAEPGHFPGSSNIPPQKASTHPETDRPASRHGRLRRSGRAARDGLARVAVEQGRSKPDAASATRSEYARAEADKVLPLLFVRDCAASVRITSAPRVRRV